METDFRWELVMHPLFLNKRKVYCRAVNQVVSFQAGNCLHCPLWNGEGDIFCCYFDFKREIKNPYDRKKYTDGLIAADFTEAFPDFCWEPVVWEAASKRWSEQEQQMVQKAYCFAAAAHNGTVRKGTKIPYFYHPMETAHYAFQLSGQAEVTAAAILHDVVEDTAYSMEDLEERFPGKVAQLVGYETENKMADRTAAETWKQRKQMALSRIQSAPLEAKMIALADKLSNIKSIEQDFRKTGNSVWERFNQNDKTQQGWYYGAMLQATSELCETPHWQEYLKIWQTLFET